MRSGALGLPPCGSAMPGCLAWSWAGRARMSRWWLERRPEQVGEIRFEASVAQSCDRGIEDVGDGATDDARLGQRTRIGLVLERTPGVELELGEDVFGRG